ncbi:MAG: hypothetical protein QOH57_1459, partial [Mycobacterium sp.]|nr:hypothetical protein [Mycobacterium sp.]
AVVRFPDPVPAVGCKVPGGWWPPLMLEPSWIARNHQHFELFHVHFGFDAIDTRVLEDVVHELTLRNKPLIYTVHDLRNPHHPEPRAHQAQLDVLTRAADKLLTLTPGASRAISLQWNREAEVLPHPHVLDPARIDHPRPATPFVVGVHVKSLRANMDPFPVLDTLVETVAALPGAVLQINVHDEIFEPGNHWFAPQAGARLRAYDDRPGVDVRIHPYFSDGELWDYLSALTVSVLPYRFGTHSGWLEACFDLGTAVIAPRCGFYDQQHPCETYEFSQDSFDPESLDRAVRTLYRRYRDGEEAPRASWEDRRAQRFDLASAHRRIYESVLP